MLGTVATLIPRGVIMRLFGGRRAPRPMSLPLPEAGRASSDFSLEQRPAAAIDLRAS